MRLKCVANGILLAGFGAVAILLGFELAVVIGDSKPIYHPGMLYGVGPMLFGLGCLREALVGHRRAQPALVRVESARRQR